MKTITINTKIINGAVAMATNYTQKDGAFAGKIVLSGTEGLLEIKATSAIETIHLKNIAFVSSDLTDDNFEAFSIDAKKLSTVLGSSKGDEVSIELNDGFVNIRSARSKVKIDTLAEVQDIPIPNAENILDIGNDILLGFNKILHSIDTNNLKYELNGAHLLVKDGTMNLVSTDTRRLSIVSANSSLKDMEIIIPKHGIVSIMKLFQGKDVTAQYDNVNFSIHTKYISYATKLINSKFPDWRRIVPTESKHLISIGRVKLLELAKEASIFEDSIIVSIADGVIKTSDYEGNTTVEDTVDYKEPIKFGISSKVLSDFLSSSEEEMVELKFNANNLPIMLVFNDTYKEVCMPIFLPEEMAQDNEAA